MTRWLCLGMATVAILGCSKSDPVKESNSKQEPLSTAPKPPPATPQVASDTKSGEVKLQELTSQDVATKALQVSLGNKVKADCSYYINPDMLGKKVISVQARIKNTSAKVMYYGYYVAFFDKDKNLAACSSFGGGPIPKLDPGKETFVGNVIELPYDQIKKIASYQVTLLEDDKEFGK